jgi:hypothetical protein
MAKTLLPENPNNSSSMTQTNKELTKSSGNFEVSPETLVPAIQRLANFYKVELSDDQWRFSLMALQGVPRDQLTSGFNRIPVTHTFMPMPAELRQACTGVPSRSLTTAAVDDDALAVKRLWGWPLKWIPWFDQSRVTVTYRAFGENPVSHEVTRELLCTGLLDGGFRPSHHGGTDILKAVRQEIEIAKARLDTYQKCHFEGRGELLARRCSRWIQYYKLELDTTRRNLIAFRKLAEKYKDAPRDDVCFGHYLVVCPENQSTRWDCQVRGDGIAAARSIKGRIAGIPGYEERIPYLERKLASEQEDHEAALPAAAADALAIQTQTKQYEDAITSAEAKLENAHACVLADDHANQLDRDRWLLDREYCLLEVPLPPPIPPMLVECLIELEGSVPEGIKRFRAFMGEGDKFLRGLFSKQARLVIVDHAELNNHAPPARQLTGAVASVNDPRVFVAVVSIDVDGGWNYYTVEGLRYLQTAGIPIGDQQLEAQELFIENGGEIMYPPLWIPSPPSNGGPLMPQDNSHRARSIRQGFHMDLLDAVKEIEDRERMAKEKMTPLPGGDPPEERTRF